jgi:hypothetical protein
MRRMIWTILGAAGLCLGQGNTPEAPKMVQRMIEVKNADAIQIAHLVEFPGISVKYNGTMHVIMVYGIESAVTQVEAMIHKLDVAPMEVDITVYILSASAQAGDDLPKDLASTGKQLHSLFPYKGYRMVDFFVTRNREGRHADVSGTLTTSAPYDFHFGSSSLSRSTPRVLRLDGVQFNLQWPTKDTEGKGAIYKTSLRTDIDVAEGQKVVVGRSSLNSPDDAIILVVTAKVVE